MASPGRYELEQMIDAELRRVERSVRLLRKQVAQLREGTAAETNDSPEGTHDNRDTDRT